MMPAHDLVNEVLQQYELGHIAQVLSLGNAGGFSGARIWRVVAGGQQFCLRLWPNESRSPDLAWVHQVLRRSFEVGVPVACPIVNRSGQTLLQSHGRCFELSPWMPGAADFNTRPNVSRLRAVLEGVAGFHETFRDSFRCVRSPAITQRCAQLAAAPQVIAKLNRGRGAPAPTALIGDLAGRLLPAVAAGIDRLGQQLNRFVSVELQLGPVIRDLHHDHVLFVEDTLSGIVDFGSMSIDTRCLDLARLIGSLEMENGPPWDSALAIYSQVVSESNGDNGLSAAEMELIELLHRCNVMLGALNWLDWILLQNRQFEDWSAVEKRLRFFENSLGV